ncbi:2-C-methyl-D-erythritol 2,4-cyclodiphosphate synthase [Candidatus Peregrinibacteria bacterium]|nr:MAG: 2-C-methyl-D-erythritol 2,4-cyclodiphosphate synthase [Candidatus Peregrinibacteria bacterium]
MNIAILLAAGASSRAGQNKLWADVHGRPLWTLSYETFKSHPEVDRIVLVVPAGEEPKFAAYVDVPMASGGETRMQSFKNGLALLTLNDEDIVIDHNAANPNVTAREISEVIAAAKEVGAAAVSMPAVDTLFVAEEGTYLNPLPREKIRLMQTPQAVRANLLKPFELADGTDLTSALLAKVPVKVVEADPANRKITFAEDLKSLCARTYLGEDSHAFSQAGQLVLGGLTVPELPALEANSDGDVILHAIGRALALAQNKNFSEIADPLALSGERDSRAYLNPLLHNVKIEQVALTLECARPRIDALAPALKNSLASLLALHPDQIRLSAHTGEGLTTFGRGEGIRCLALLTIKN